MKVLHPVFNLQYFAFPFCLVMLFLSVCLVPESACAQDTLKLSLQDIVSLSKENTPDVALARTRLSNNFWRYQSFKADFKPQLTISGNVPVLNRSISAITLPDGTDAFIRRSLTSSSLQLSLSQNIPFTGGRVFANTSLSWINLLSDSGNSNSFLATPFSVGIQQPIANHNAFRWDRQLQPLIFEEAQKEFAEELEEKGLEGTNLFFDIFVAQISLEAAQIDKNNADSLFLISQGRYNVGKIAENELLQMELSANQSEVNVSQAILDLQNSTETLRIFLGIKEKVSFDLISPEEIPEYEIDVEKAVDNARKNRKAILEFERRLLEADRDVAKAKAENGFNGTLFATFGISGTGNNLADAYSQNLDQEQLTFGIQVPIADWGKSKAERKIAESNKELVELTVEQERINFEQDIILKVQQFDLVKNRLKLGKKSYDIALKRYDITRKRYLIGKIGVTELNIALEEQTNARQAYMQSLRAFWYAHYELRRLTLYDFQEDKPLELPKE